MEFARRLKSGLLLLIATLFLVTQTGLTQLEYVVSAAVLDNGATITVLNKDGSKVMETKAVAFEEGANAFDLLDEVADIQYESYDFGPMITGINNVFPEGGDYWGFFVNGKGSNEGAADYQVQKGDNILFKIVSWPPTEVNVSVSAVDLEGNDVIPETSVTIVEGATAYDALVQAANKAGVDLSVYIDSQWLTGLLDIDHRLNGANAFWSASINGEFMQVGLVSYHVKDGEQLQLKAVPIDPPNGEEPIEDEDKQGDDSQKPNNDDQQKDDNQQNNDGQQNKNNNNDEKTDNIEQNKNNRGTISEEELENSVEKAVNYLTAKGYFDWHTIIAFNQLGKDVPDQYIQQVIDDVILNSGDYRNVTELVKTILILTSSGIDATDIAEINLIDKLTSHDRMTNQGNNGPIYSLLALDSGNYSVKANVKWDREELIKTILEAQLANGSWALFGETPNIDITAMAITALGPYADQANVKAAIDDAVEWLSATYLSKNGFYDEYNGGEASESIAQAIIGLTANHIDPAGEQFTKEEHNLVSHLMAYQNEDGGFSHLIEDNKSNDIATSQALLGLVAYQNYLNGKSPFDSNNKELKDFTGTPQPNNPTDNTQTQGGDQTGDDPAIDETSDVVETDNTTDGETLPNTATNHYQLFLYGAVLLIVASILFIYQRKKLLNK